MKHTKVTDNTYQINKNLEGVLFEGLWEIPNGTSVNSFIVQGDDVAIIDGFWDTSGLTDLKDALDELGIDPKEVKYSIVNHMEPDHSDWLQVIHKLNPDVTIVCNEKSKELLEAFYGIVDNVKVLKEGDSIDLGQGHVLTMYSIPNVHWPDTMAMYDERTKTLFSCDAFGSFGRVPNENYDDKLSPADVEFYAHEAVRYYSNIIASFSIAVKAALKKIESLEIDIIAPGHGIVWRENPDRIIQDYIKYSAYMEGNAEEKITVIWGSMYGMTKMAVDKIVEALNKEGISYDIYNVPETDPGQILKSVWESTGVILAMPTYEYKMFPPMAGILRELGLKKMKNKYALRTGSFGWSGGAQRELDKIMDDERMDWNFLEPVEFRGRPDDDHLNKLEDRVKELIELVKENKLDLD